MRNGFFCPVFSTPSHGQYQQRCCDILRSREATTDRMRRSVRTPRKPEAFVPDGDGTGGDFQDGGVPHGLLTSPKAASKRGHSRRRGSRIGVHELVSKSPAPRRTARVRAASPSSPSARPKAATVTATATSTTSSAKVAAAAAAAKAPSSTTSGIRARQVLMTGGSRFLCQLNRLAWGPLLVFMAQDLTLSNAEKGGILSAFSGGYLWFQIIGGKLGDQYGVRLLQ